jgi:hypothetical protein
MKTNLIKIAVAILMLVTHGRLAWSQGFVNLDFEHPILPLPTSSGNVLAANAIPGWTVYYGNSNNPTAAAQPIMGYDTVSLGGAAVILEDTNAPSGIPLPIQGNYSVLLEGSAYSTAPLPVASIGQTGTVPITAQSLTFFGNLAANTQGQNLQVTFNGQPLSFMDISNTLNYTIWGADISAYAGQTGQLLFTTPVLGYALLDNIQFSFLPVPEPSTFALTALGALFLGFNRWRYSSR